MQLILSPSKQIKITHHNHVVGTMPVFDSNAKYLLSKLLAMDIEAITKHLKVSSQLAIHAKQLAYHLCDGSAERGMAIDSFSGVAFKAFHNLGNLSESSREFAQSHLLIGSGAYGLLHSNDLICEYRLDFESTLIDDNRASVLSMTNYWKPIVTPLLIEIAKNDDSIVLNLASKETTDSLDMSILRNSGVIFIDVRFLHHGPKGLRMLPSVELKKMRGSFARFFVDNRCCSIDELKCFGMGNFETVEFVDNELIFVR